MKNYIISFLNYLSSKYFFWNLVLFYCLSKLCPIISYTNIFTVSVFIISIIIFVLRIIKLLFFDKKILINHYRLISLLIFAFGTLSYLINSKFSIKILLIDRDYSPIVTLFVNFVVIFVVEEQDSNEIKIQYFKKISNFMLYFSFIYSFITLVYTFVINGDRPEGLGCGVINYSHFTLYAFAFSFCALIFNLNNNKLKYFCIICLIFQTFMLLYNQQRNGYLGIFVGTIVLIFILFKTNNLNKLFASLALSIKSKYALVVMTFVLSIILLVLTQKYGIINKIISMSTSKRVDIWKATFNNFYENNILFGYGGTSWIKAINFIEKYPEIANDTEVSEFLKRGWTHNTYISHLCEYGLINFALVAFFIVSYVAKFIKYIINNISSKYIIIYIIVFSYFVVAPLSMGLFDENLFTGYFSFDNLIFFMFASFIFESENKVVK